MIDMHNVIRLTRCFRGSFVNEHGEFIAHRRSNTFFRLDNCENELDIKCKVLEWLSRAASKGQPYKADKDNLVFQQFMLDGINAYLGTNFSYDDIDEVYTYLGNGCNHAKTLVFIETGYNVSMLPARLEET